MTPFILDYTIERILNEQPNREQAFFRIIFGAEIPKNDAREYFERMLDHKWYVSEKLGRDIGLHVAALDFAVNIEPLPMIKRRQQNIDNRLNRALKFGLSA